MDRWKEIELEKMKVSNMLHALINTLISHCTYAQVGGNSRLTEFFFAQSDVHTGMSLRDKYNTRAAALYRDKVNGFLSSLHSLSALLVFPQINALSEGRSWSEESSPARHHRPPSSSYKTSSSSSKGSALVQ